VRCLQLSDELDKFVKERNRNDPQRNIEHADATDAEIYRHTQTMMRYDQETRNQYRDQLKGKVDMLRADLQRLDWWKPKKDVESLEDPSHLDDVQGISNYLRWIGHGFPI
jgi:hypothetical protein